MHIIDLFCGTGGLSWGFQEAGHTIVAAYDNSPVAVKHYNRNVGPHAHLADLRTLTAADLPETDAIVGSPPCQPFSSGARNPHTGQTKGPTDERNLIPDFVRLVVAKQPRFFLMENVPGLLSYSRYLAQALRPLFEAGYLPAIIKLNAAHYGVPQDRKRIFVAGYRNGRLPLWPAPTHTQRNAITTRHALNALIQAGPHRPIPPYLKHFAGHDLLVEAQDRGMHADKTRYYRARSLDTPAYTVHASERQGSKRAIVGDHSTGLGVRHNRILQTFPPDWQLPTNPKEAMRLIGNAVPPLLAYHIARAIMET